MHIQDYEEDPQQGCEFKRKRHEQWSSLRKESHRIKFEETRKRLLINNPDNNVHNTNQKTQKEQRQNQNGLKGYSAQSQAQFVQKLPSQQVNRDQHSIDFTSNQKLPLLIKKWQIMAESPKIIIDTYYKDMIQGILTSNLQNTDIEEIIAAAGQTQDVFKLHWGVIALRWWCSHDKLYEIMPIIIDSGIVNTLFNMVQQTYLPQLKMQASWILTNIASGNHQCCQFLINKNIVNVFVGILAQNQKHIVDQAVWCLGNLAADCIQYRDIVLQAGCLGELIKIAKETSSQKLFNSACWAISNLCLGNPLPKYKIIRQGLLFISQAVCSDFFKGDLLKDAIYTIQINYNKPTLYYTDLIRTDMIEWIINRGIIQASKLHPNLPVVQNILLFVGNMCCASTDCTQLVLDKKALTFLQVILAAQSLVSFHNETMWTLTNVSAGSKSQVTFLLSHQNILQICSILMQQSQSKNTRHEAICFFTNMTFMGSPAEVAPVIKKYQVFKCILRQLDQQLSKNEVLSLLRSLRYMLQEGQKDVYRQSGCNVFRTQILANIESLNTLFALQRHKSKDVYATVVLILQEHFSEYLNQ